MKIMPDLIKVLLFTAGAPCAMALLRQISRWRRGVSSSARLLATSVADLRKEYSKQGLLESDTSLTNGPFQLFTKWLQDACEAKVLEPNAMCLSTCENDRPSARFVLLKGFDERGFVWYTNYQSRKGGELIRNPHASLTFWWGELERQVRIEGNVEQVSEEESDTYFHSRPKSSQIGAWTSNQSQTITNREALEAQEKEIIAKFQDLKVIPRPPHWGGFRLIPTRIEFWKGRESRLHDRIVYERDSTTATWSMNRLQP